MLALANPQPTGNHLQLAASRSATKAINTCHLQRWKLLRRSAVAAGCGRRHLPPPCRHPTCSCLLSFAGQRSTNQAWRPTRNLVGDDCCWPVQHCCCASAALWPLMAQQRPPSRRQPARRQQRQMARQAVQATAVRVAEFSAELAEAEVQLTACLCQPASHTLLYPPISCHHGTLFWLCHPTAPQHSNLAADPHWNWDVWYGDLKPYKDHKFRHDYWYQVRA